MHHVTSAKVRGQPATDCQRSAGLTENKWCLVNKLNYCFNSCSLITFAGRRVLHKGTGEWRNDSEDEGRKNKRKRWNDGTWTHTFSLHRSITLSLWLHWRRSNYINNPEHLTGLCAAFCRQWALPFVSQLNVITVVLYWVGPGHQAVSLPWHQLSDNKQETDLNFTNWYTEYRLSIAKTFNEV